MIRVGIISDTHGYLDSKILELFQNVDQIIHAGDVGAVETLGPLERIAPLTAVSGNTDIFLPFPTATTIELGGKSFFVQHIVKPERFSVSKNENISAVVFGHTHRSHESVIDGVCFINPGYSGRPRKGTNRSVAIAEIRKASLGVHFFELN